MAKSQTQLADHYVFLKALKEVMVAASLDGIDTRAAKIQKLPFNRSLTFTAGLYISPVPEEVVPRGSAGDIFTLKGTVTIVSAPTNGELSEEDEINRTLLWRQNLYEYLLPLIDQPLPACPFLRDLNVSPGPLFDIQGFQAMFDVSQVVVAGDYVKYRGSQNAR
jgi:hypothetical protein